MSSIRKSITLLHPSLKKGIREVQKDVFAHYPLNHQRTGFQKAKKQLTGVYLAQYYEDSMDKHARMHIPGYKTEQEERRETKLVQLRRRGKGPPKKGAGGRKKK